MPPFSIFFVESWCPILLYHGTKNAIMKYIIDQQQRQQQNKDGENPQQVSSPAQGPVAQGHGTGDVWGERTQLEQHDRDNHDKSNNKNKRMNQTQEAQNRT